MISIKQLTAPIGEAGYIPFVELVRATGMSPVGSVYSNAYKRWQLSYDGKEHVTITNKYSKRVGRFYTIDLVSGDMTAYEKYADGEEELLDLYNQKQIISVYEAFGIELPRSKEQLDILQKIKFAVSEKT